MPGSSCSYGDIVEGLRRIGLERGAVVEVHSSLKAMGWVDGGAATVVRALMDVVTPEGTVVMSAYPVTRAVPLTDEDRARGLAWKVRKLPLDSTEPTGMGAIADCFRTQAGVHCGTELHRTCAWGRDAEWHATGYQGLLALDGWCLLVGVGIDRCSSMHAAEYVPLPPEIARCLEVPEETRRLYDPELWDIGCGEGSPEDAWGKVWERADGQGLIRHGRVCSAASHLFRARSVVSIYRDWRRTDPHGLYGVPRPERAERSRAGHNA
jgi:aminoglycoside N3'-acetyltransferase